MVYKKFIAMAAYKPEHLDELIPELRGHDADNVHYNGGEDALRKAFAEFEEFGLIQTFMTYENKVAAIFLMIQTEPGHAIMWAITGNEVDRMPKAFVHACKRILPMINACLEVPLVRLDAYVRADYGRSMKWLERLCFKLDASMTQQVGKYQYLCFTRNMGGAHG